MPTRELAIQVGECVSQFAAHTPLTSTTIFGGVGLNPQARALRAGCDVVVATPGRLLDHLGRGSLDLSGVEMLVLDEADRMLDMGFVRDIRRILKKLPETRQNLLFSATFADSVRIFAEGLLRHPRRIDIAKRNSTVETVTQRVLRVERQAKPETLADLIHSGGWERVLVFSRTKYGANKLAQKLERTGLTAAAIHGNKSQGARSRALAGFKHGQVRVLVATDIAARGLDIDGLPHVVNFDLPEVAEDYVHRIGRTGRAGASGEALSLVSKAESPLLRAIEKLIGMRIPAHGGEHCAASNPGQASLANGATVGTVSWFSPTKGFGFIATEMHGKDVFVHVSTLHRAGIPELTEGQRLQFNVVPGRDGRSAADNLRLID